jgi:cation:H+ antiporter
MILLWSAVFVISLYVLVKASDYFNLSAEKIGISFGLSPFVIGVLMLGAGTSLPELITSIASMVKGSSEMVPANVIGSNIANIFFVLGLSVILAKKPIRLHYNFSDLDIQFSLGSTTILVLTGIDGVFNVWEGTFCLFIFGVYISNLFSIRGIAPPQLIPEEIMDQPKKKEGLVKYYLLFFLSIFLLYMGGNWAIEAVIVLSEHYNIGKEIIATSAIAIGTSLPELFVCLNAFRKGKPDLAVGNILGSCIFNVLMIMGASSFFGDIVFLDNIRFISIPFLVIATILFFFTTRDKQINRYEGILYLSFFILYLVKIFNVF